MLAGRISHAVGFFSGLIGEHVRHPRGRRRNLLQASAGALFIYFFPHFPSPMPAELSLNVAETTASRAQPLYKVAFLLSPSSTYLARDRPGARVAQAGVRHGRGRRAFDLLFCQRRRGRQRGGEWRRKSRWYGRRVLVEPGAG